LRRVIKSLYELPGWIVIALGDTGEEGAGLNAWYMGTSGLYATGLLATGL